MSMSVLESSTRESKATEITTPSDPTSTPPDFAIVTDSTLQPTDWKPGTWQGTWDATTGTIKAISPLIGAGQILDVAQGVDYNLYVRWNVPATGEDPVRLVERIRVT